MSNFSQDFFSKDYFFGKKNSNYLNYNHRSKKEVPSAQYEQINLDNQELPYIDEYFDLITAFDVLEHTKSIEGSLQKIVRQLKKDGYLILSLPIKDTCAGKIFHFFDTDKSHISVPRKKELFSILEKTGLKILKKNYFWNMIFLRWKGVPVDIELILQKK